MKTFIVSVLVLVAMACIIAAWVQKANYVTGTAERIKIESAGVHGNMQVKNDQLAIQNDLLEDEIATREHKRYDTQKIESDRIKLSLDEHAADEAIEAKEAIAPEDTDTEWIEVCVAAACIAVAILVGTKIK